MSDGNNENLKELFERFLSAEQADEALKDVVEGERILREYPAPRPSGKLVAGIKFKIIGALLLRRARAFRYVGYIAAAAAVLMFVAIIGIKILQKDGGAPRMVAKAAIIPSAVWENDDSAAANAELLVLSAEIEQARQEMLALELGENGGNGNKEITELEMEYIEISSDFWKG